MSYISTASSSPSAFHPGRQAMQSRAGVRDRLEEPGTRMNGIAAVTAKIIFDPQQIAGYAGALRLLRLGVKQAILLPQALPLRWNRPQPSPVSGATGSWSATESPGEPAE